MSKVGMEKELVGFREASMEPGIMSLLVRGWWPVHHRMARVDPKREMNRFEEGMERNS